MRQAGVTEAEAASVLNGQSRKSFITAPQARGCEESVNKSLLNEQKKLKSN